MRIDGIIEGMMKILSKKHIVAYMEATIRWSWPIIGPCFYAMLMIYRVYSRNQILSRKHSHKNPLYKWHNHNIRCDLGHTTRSIQSLTQKATCGRGV
jgi:hypothetical protein